MLSVAEDGDYGYTKTLAAINNNKAHNKKHKTHVRKIANWNLQNKKIIS